MLHKTCMGDGIPCTIPIRSHLADVTVKVIRVQHIWDFQMTRATVVWRM